MSLTGSESSVEGLPLSEAALLGGNGAVNVSQVWLDGDVLSCACPECGAPMTVRLWLRQAECRMCGAQVVLSEEQERVAQELLQQRALGARRIPPPLKPQSWSQPVRPPPLPPRTPAPPQTPPPLVAIPVIEPPPLPIAVPVDDDDDDRKPVPPPRRRWVSRQLLETVLSCLVSLLFHMLIVLLLGLWFFPKPKAATMILSAEFEVQQAGPQGSDTPVIITSQPPPPQPVMAPPTEPPDVDRTELVRLETIMTADKLVVEPELPAPSFVALGHVRPGTMFAGRDPQVRKQVVRQEGGNDLTERAVALGLKWLAKHQNTDGSWSLDQFDLAGDCDGRCKDHGLSSDTAATALGVLPFLGAGYTHLHGEYCDVVKPAVEWLVADQRADGSFNHIGHGSMYAHGQATIALCEAYALTRDRTLRDPAQRAVNYIVAAQHAAGGWRYQPKQRGDLSVTGWEVMALQSAKTAYLVVPPETLLRIDAFLTSVQTSSQLGTFGYTNGRSATPAMTAEGLLCRQYGGWKADFPPLTAGADYLLDENLPHPREVNMYYWYYGTQVMHHIGGDRWRRWNERMKSLLVDLQDQSGHEAGSWAPGKYHDGKGGRVYMTSLAVCTLEVYYRHLPLYRSLP